MAFPSLRASAEGAIEATAKGADMSTVFKATLMSALLLAIVSLGTSEAKADPVTFSTSGTFTCGGCAGSGTNSVTFLGGMGNALMITFTGLGSTSLNTPTGSSFGNFQTFVSGTGAVASGTFTLDYTNHPDCRQRQLCGNFQRDFQR